MRRAGHDDQTSLNGAIFAVPRLRHNKHSKSYSIVMRAAVRDWTSGLLVALSVAAA